MKTNKGFTVIELLVVIAIIGILATIIIASVSAARERARLASAMQLEANILHGAGDQLALEWKFNEGAGTARDSSGNGKNGTVSGATWNATGGYDGSGAYTFSGGSGSISNTFSSAVPAASGTISFWVKPTTLTPGGLLDTGGNPRGYFVRGDAPGRLIFGLHAIGSMEYNNFFTSANKWYLVTVVWNGSVATVYRDGGSSSKTADLGGSPISLSSIIVGRDDTGTSNATIDNVRFYTKAFTAMDVQKLYAQTSPAYIALNQ